MARAPSTAAETFVSRLRSLEYTRRKVEGLFAQSLVARRDVEHVYGSIFLAIVTSFEGLIEELFLGLLTRRYSAPAGVHPRVIFRSDRVAREVVFEGRNYINWFPYNETEARAERFFRGGRPFKRQPTAGPGRGRASRMLNDADFTSMMRVWRTRNAIAHQSAFARRKFEEDVVGTTPLRPRERTPAGFLRSIIRVAPAQTRYEQIASELAAITYKLCG